MTNNESSSVQDFSDSRYIRKSVLGFGRFGVVYSAFDSLLERDVAIKVCCLKAAEHQKRFRSEAQRMAQLRHEAIIPVFDIGETSDGTPFFVMPLLEGGTLADRLEQSGPLPMTKAAQLVTRVAQALSYCHARKLVHRDVKPCNILFDGHENAVLADFGLSIERESAAGEIAGTIEYMSPEQIYGDALDGRADIWALGIVLYESLTGIHPFTANRSGTSSAVLFDEPVPLRQVNESLPKELEEICIKCLSKKPEDRYGSVSDLEEVLISFTKTRQVFCLPIARNISFSARDDIIQEIHRNVKEATLPIVLFGLPGVGKTQIAVEYAHRFSDGFDHVFWIDGSNDVSTRRSLLTIAEHLGIDSRDAGKVKTLVKAWLSQNSGWLLLFDDIENFQAIEHFAAAGSGHILATSRSPHWDQSALPIRIAEFKRSESVAFLKKTIKGDETSSTEPFEKLAQALGDLPLALAQASAYINENEVALSEYVSLFKTHRKRIWESDKEFERPSNYPFTIATTIQMALAKIGIPSSLDLLSILAYLAPTQIPRIVPAIAMQITENAEEKDSLLVANDAIAALRRYSLVDADRAMLRVHGLVQVVVRDQKEQEGNTAEWLSFCVRAIGRVVCWDGEDTRSWRAYEQMAPHIEAIQVFSNEAEVESAELVELLAKYGKFLSHRGFSDESEAISSACIVLAESLYGGSSSDLVPFLSNYAVALNSLGRSEEACNYFQRAIDLSNGSVDVQKAVLLHNFACALRSTNKEDQAREYLDESRRILESDSSRSSTQLAISLADIGDTLLKQGDYSGAESYLLRAMQIYDDLQAGHVARLTTAQTLGDLYLEQKMYGQARRYFSEAWAGFQLLPKELSDSDMHGILAYKLGICCTSDGDVSEVRSHFEYSLRKLEKVCKGRPLAWAESAAKMSLLLFTHGHHQGASDIATQALSALESIEAPPDKLVAGCCNTLAMSLRDMQRFSEARVHATRAFSVASDATNEFTDLDRAMFSDNLAAIDLASGAHKAAKKQFEISLGLYEGLSGPLHSEASVCLTGLGRIAMETGDLQDSEKLLLQALSVSKSKDRPRGSSQCMNYLALLYAKKKDTKKALAYHEQALEIEEKEHGSRSPAIAVTLCNIGCCHRELGNVKKSKLFLERAFANCTALGPSHHYTVRIKRELKMTRALHPSAQIEQSDKQRRNDKCKCGSGKKYKNCCLPKNKASFNKTNRDRNVSWWV